MVVSEEKSYVKVPTFDGRKSQWPFFKSKFKSYLAQKDMVEVLTFSDPIPKDNKVWTSEEMKIDKNKLAKKVKEQNKSATVLVKLQLRYINCSILLSMSL